jgi:hypothetical protein
MQQKTCVPTVGIIHYLRGGGCASQLCLLYLRIDVGIVQFGQLQLRLMEDGPMID